METNPRSRFPRWTILPNHNHHHYTTQQKLQQICLHEKSEGQTVTKTRRDSEKWKIEPKKERDINKENERCT